MFRPFAALLIAAFALLSPAAAQNTGADDRGADATGQAERIISYFSDIYVAADASLHVTETIRVRAAGQNIRHGIYRDIPTQYERDGRVVSAAFTVDGVQRNDRSEPWRQEATAGGVRVWIGDAGQEIAPGEHSYVFRYTMTHQLDFSSDRFDELYWNVTGNYWQFPIDAAGARVRLPRPVRFSQISFYTGASGARGTDAEIAAQNPGEIVLRTTQPLAEGEGLIILLAWPKNVIHPSEGASP